jgi:hypothetical protein
MTKTEPLTEREQQALEQMREAQEQGSTLFASAVASTQSQSPEPPKICQPRVMRVVWPSLPISRSCAATPIAGCTKNSTAYVETSTCRVCAPAPIASTLRATGRLKTPLVLSSAATSGFVVQREGSDLTHCRDRHNDTAVLVACERQPESATRSRGRDLYTDPAHSSDAIVAFQFAFGRQPRS